MDKHPKVIELENELNAVFMRNCLNENAWGVCEQYRKKYKEENVICRAEAFDEDGFNHGGSDMCSVYIKRDVYDRWQLYECLCGIASIEGGVEPLKENNSRWYARCLD